MFTILSLGVYTTLAFAQAEKGPVSKETIFTTLIPFALIFVLFYVLIILPQQKKQKKHKAMLDTMKKGDKVVTSSGLIGTIANLSKDVVTLQVADNVKIRIMRSHIAEMRTGGEEE